MNFPIPDFLPLLLALTTLAGIVLATVAGIRRTWPAIDGWRAVLTVVIVSLVLCTGVIAWYTPALWWRGLIMGSLAALLALGGDQYLVRLAGKSKQTTVQVTPMPDATSQIIPPAPKAPTITEL